MLKKKIICNIRLNAANSWLFLHSVYHVQRDGCFVCPVIRRAAEVYSLGVEYRRSTRIYCLVFFERTTKRWLLFRKAPYVLVSRTNHGIVNAVWVTHIALNSLLLIKEPTRTRKRCAGRFLRHAGQVYKVTRKTSIDSQNVQIFTQV